MQLSNLSYMVSRFQKQGELVCGTNGGVDYLLQLSMQNEGYNTYLHVVVSISLYMEAVDERQ